MHRAMKRRGDLPAVRLALDGYASAPLGQEATFTLDECTGAGASKGKRQLLSLPSMLANSPHTVQPSGAEPHPAHPSTEWVATAHFDGTYGEGGLLAAISMDPWAGEFRCLGPRHKTVSNEITPAQASMVSAHSVGIDRGTIFPFLSYHEHSSATSCKAAASVWKERWFQPAVMEVSVLGAGVAGRGGGSLAPKMYRPCKRGMPSGRLGRTAIWSAARSLGSLRFFTSRRDRMRTEKEGSLIMSCTSSAVTERPSRISVVTSQRKPRRRSAEKMPLRGPA